jgi:hypothetical protein
MDLTLTVLEVKETRRDSWYGVILICDEGEAVAKLHSSQGFQ